MLPTKFDIQVAFNCPECGNEWWAMGEEAKRGYTFFCCDKNHKVPALRNLRIDFDTGVVKREPKKKDVKQKKEAISIMVGVGYTREIARELVDKVYSDNLNTQELVKLAIAKDE